MVYQKVDIFLVLVAIYGLLDDTRRLTHSPYIEEKVCKNKCLFNPLPHYFY